MIQGHAYEGWASPTAKQTAAYAFTRFLGTFPLPAFLVLAGAALALRVDAAVEKNESATVVRWRIIVRGLQIVLYGYATNFAYAVLDGWDHVGTLLRVDVLHCIGLSIAITGAVGVSGDSTHRHPSRTRLAWTTAVLGAAATLTCPWITRAAHELDLGPAGMIVGLFAEVPGVTAMPVIPLIAWLSVGVIATQWLLWCRQRAPIAEGEFPGGGVVGLGLFGATLALAGNAGTVTAVQQWGASFSRADPVVWLNVVDLGGRGVVVLSVGAMVGRYVTGWLQSALVRFGQGSLIAYVFHIPFCYGSLGRSMIGQLTMTQATAGIVLLVASSWLAVWMAEWLAEWVRPPVRQIGRRR